MAILTAALAPAQSQSGLGSLSLVVTDTQGAPIPGAVVQYRRKFLTVPDSFGQPRIAPGEPVAQGALTADATGASQAQNLPPGSYSLCASVPSAPYLDPCSWRGGLLVSVSANATAAQTITLAKGVFLKVRVNDPLGLLPQSVDGPLGPRKLVVGVTFGTGAFLGAQNIAVDAAGRNYQMAIPAGQPLGLWLFSQDISLADSTGARVNLSGRPSPFQAMPGEDQVLSFTVTGPAVSGTLQ